ncbi:Manganese transporter smf1 [Sorochytrium milnesiophthora]
MARLQSIQSHTNRITSSLSRTSLMLPPASPMTSILDISPLRRHLSSLTPLRNPAKRQQLGASNRRHTIAPSLGERPFTSSLTPRLANKHSGSSLMQATPLRRQSTIFDEIASESGSPAPAAEPRHHTLAEFLDLVDVRFVDLLTSVRYKKPTAAELAALTGPTPNDDLKTIAVHYTYLEMYAFACRELANQIMRQLQIIQDMEAKTDQSNPPFFADFQRSDKLEQHLLKEQIKCTQVGGRLSARQEWTLWYHNMLNQAQASLEERKATLAEDAARLSDYQTQQAAVDAARTFLHLQTQRLQLSHERMKKRSERDADEHAQLLTQIEAESVAQTKATETISKQKLELLQLQEKLAHLKTRQTTLQSDIQRHETICSTSTFYTVKDLERIREPYTALTALTGVEVKVSGSNMVVVKYLADFSMILERRRDKLAVKDIQLLAKPAFKQLSKIAAAALMHDVKTLSAPAETVLGVIRRWRPIKQLLLDIDDVAASHMAALEERKHGELQLVVHFMRFPAEKFDLMFDLPTGFKRAVQPQDVSILHFAGPDRSELVRQIVQRHYDIDALSLKLLSRYVDSFTKALAFIGPGFLISVGYLDPGNWATDLAAGSRFGYSLLVVILLSNCCALVVQYLCIKLGVVTGMDLAQACRHHFSKRTSLALWVLAEIAMVATDLAEVIGSAIALNILFGVPVLWAVLLTGIDVVFVLLFYKSEGGLKSVRAFEMFIMVLVLAVGFCFVAELVLAKPVASDVLAGFLPTAAIFGRDETYVALGIVGATLMPHNLYLHSHAVKARASPDAQLGMSIPATLKYAFIDCVFALTIALFVNAAILIVSGANFYYGQEQSEVADLYAAYRLLSKSPGQAAATVFAVALLLSGQSSCITATLAGSVVMEGFVDVQLRPWLRRLVTRLMSVVPAVLVVLIKGADGLNELLVFSQVLLSLQLPFALVPLVYFTSRSSSMSRTQDIQLRAITTHDEAGNPWQSLGENMDAFLSDESSDDEDTAQSSADVARPTPKHRTSTPADRTKHTSLLAGEASIAADTDDDGVGPPHATANYANSWTLTVLASSIAVMLIAMNCWLLIQTAMGATS